MITLTLLTFGVGAFVSYVIGRRKRKSGAVANETAAQPKEKPAAEPGSGK